MGSKNTFTCNIISLTNHSTCFQSINSIKTNNKPIQTKTSIQSKIRDNIFYLIEFKQKCFEEIRNFVKSES